MKRLFILILAVAMILSSGTAMAAMKIKLGVVTKPGSAQNIAAEKFKELIEQRSSGKINVQIFHSASLGNETEILQQVQLNTIQMAIVTGGPFDTFDPMARVVNYPFLFKDNEQADKIVAELSALSGEAFDKRYAENELAYHKSVNSLVKDAFIPNIENAEVKALFEQGLIIFKGHEKHAEMMVASLNGK